MTKLTDSKRVILISFWCDYFPSTSCSNVQELCDYVEDNDLAEELDSVGAYVRCMMDFVSRSSKQMMESEYYNNNLR